NIRVVGDHHRFLDTSEEMQQIHEWPGEVVMDHIGLLSKLAEAIDYAIGKPCGRDMQMKFGAMHAVISDHQLAGPGIVAESKHLAVDTMGKAALAELEDHLLNAAHRIGQVGFKKVQYAHQQPN